MLHLFIMCISDEAQSTHTMNQFNWLAMSEQKIRRRRKSKNGERERRKKKSTRDMKSNKMLIETQAKEWKNQT